MAAERDKTLENVNFHNVNSYVGKGECLIYVTDAFWLWGAVANFC